MSSTDAAIALVRIFPSATSDANIARETNVQALVLANGEASLSQGTWINVALDPHSRRVLELKAIGLGQETKQLAVAVLSRALSGRSAA